MHILAFNSSPRDNQTSKTELLLQQFLDGAGQAGAETETLYLRQYKIKHCLGCFGCWVKTPGRCVQADDMTQKLFDRFLQADLVVLATPLYHFTMNARLKMFIERTLPMFQPYFIDRGERSGHPPRFEKLPRVVALSVCAFPEQSSFSALSLTMKMIFGTHLAAEIYRHSSEFMAIPDLAPRVQEVLAAAARAGGEVVRDGLVSPDTLQAITQDLAPRELLIRMINEYWQQELGQSGIKQ
jgi:hypothetical protein